MIEIHLNGRAEHVPELTSIAELLVLTGYGGRRVAVERNGEIVPRSARRHALGARRSAGTSAGDRRRLTQPRSAPITNRTMMLSSSTTRMPVAIQSPTVRWYFTCGVAAITA